MPSFPTSVHSVYVAPLKVNGNTHGVEVSVVTQPVTVFGSLGASVGAAVGVAVGAAVGAADGSADGAAVGVADGAAVGVAVGPTEAQGVFEHCTLFDTTFPSTLLMAYVQSTLLLNVNVFPVLVTPSACSPLQ